jgi:hypothetical protein
MKYLSNLEFEINYRIRELINTHGLMSIYDPRVAKLFMNFAAIQRLKERTYQSNQDYAGRHDGT